MYLKRTRISSRNFKSWKGFFGQNYKKLRKRMSLKTQETKFFANWVVSNSWVSTKLREDRSLDSDAKNEITGCFPEHLQISEHTNGILKIALPILVIVPTVC